MRTALAALGLLAALPAAAQAQTTWSGMALSITGNRTNGCDLRVIQVTHSGSTLSSVQFQIMNRSSTAARATMEVTLAGNGQRKMGTVSGLIGAGTTGVVTGFYPFGGSLAGTQMTLRFLGCTRA